jgi:phosphoglycerate kinase
MNKIPGISDINCSGRRVLVREDFNVPIADGVVADTSRIDRAIPTIQQLLKANAAVMLCSHLGRPVEGEYDAAFSLAPIAQILSDKLGLEVRLQRDWLQGVEIQPGEVVLCENVRCNPGEAANDISLAKQMASLCDVFVMDAFATAHREQASTTGIIHYVDYACAGPLLLQELTMLEQALAKPARPLLAVVGGAKVSTKIQLLESLLNKVDVLIVGGGIANTFLKAAGFEIGKSLYEPDFVELAQRLILQAKEQQVAIPLPQDVVVATEFSAAAEGVMKSVGSVAADELILDVGSATSTTYAGLLAAAKTVLWNGPVGVFEFPAFAAGTQQLGQAIVNSEAFSIAGGGDTVSALTQFELTSGISYVSTGGGAFLSYLQGEELPAVKALMNKRVGDYAK